MEKNLQYLLDRLAIEDQVKRYATLVDRKLIDQLNEVFTDDAWIDYTASGGAAGNLEETKAYLKAVFGPTFTSTQHMMGNVVVDIAEDGKSAVGEVMLFNPLSIGDYTFFCGVWYHDEWIKTDEGIWKMRRRVQENSYAYHRPLPPAPPAE